MQIRGMFSVPLALSNDQTLGGHREPWSATRASSVPKTQIMALSKRILFSFLFLVYLVHFHVQLSWPMGQEVPIDKDKAFIHGCPNMTLLH